MGVALASSMNEDEAKSLKQMRSCTLGVLY